MPTINYEDFYQGIQQTEKSLKDKLQQAQRSFKNISRDSEQGNIKKLLKDVEELCGLSAELNELSAKLQNDAQSFDTSDYFESGEFTRQMLEYCQQYGVDIQGEAVTYEMFPFRLRIDTENQDLYVNRKKVQNVRPKRFVQDMKQQIEKYTKAGFNLNQFVNELAAAYDLALKIKNSESPAPRYEIDISLKDIYNCMAPTARARRDYDLQQFAFELSKLYSADEILTKNERRYEFGSSRNVNKMIRILDSEGTEQFLATIRFFKL